MVNLRGERASYKRPMDAASQSTSKQQQQPRHRPQSKAGPTSRLPLPIPPGTAASKYEHIFMDHCEFRPSPVHGFGVFAARDIQPGTLIIQEKALWVVDTQTAMKSTFSKTSDYGIPRFNMIQAFYNSNSDEKDGEEQVRLKRDIITLCGGFSDADKVLGDELANMQTMSEHLREILILNGVAESGDGRPEYAAIFRASSRLNHSCAPTAERMRSRLNDGSVVSHTVLPNY